MSRAGWSLAWISCSGNGVVNCRAEAPGAKIEETFAEAFASQETADECAADPLVVVNPCILRPMLGMVVATEKNYGPAVELTLPFLVRSLWDGNPLWS